MALKAQSTIAIIRNHADSLIYFQISPLENGVPVQCLKIKEKEPLFIWKGETIKGSRNNRRKHRLKMEIFGMEYVELEVLAGKISRWKH